MVKSLHKHSLGNGERSAGDLMLIQLGDVLVMTVVVDATRVATMRVAFGDTELDMPWEYGLSVRRDSVDRAAGQFIGQSFASVDEARDRLQPFVRQLPTPAGSAVGR